MGIELSIGLGLASAVVSLVGGISAANKEKQAASLRREAFEERKQARNVSIAKQNIDAERSRRAAVREQRVRRAQILASSSNTGTAGSSGEVGAVGALSSNLRNLLGQSLGDSAANEAISTYLQSSEDLESQALQFSADASSIGAFSGAISNTLGSFGNAFEQSRR